MATNSSQLQETILKAIDAVVTQRNNDLKLDKTITGIVKKNVGKRGDKPLYQVEYSGGIIEAVTQSAEDIYFPHSAVYVLVPQGNFSNEKIILGRASTVVTDRSSSVVAAAVNNYSIVGANLLESVTSDESIKDIKYGLHSFHPNFRDEEHGINHRAQFLYQFDNQTNSKIKFNDNRLNIYKEDATALMIKADFLTNLDSIQKQQPNARYGLIFNFAFDNLNKGYGETNGEILDNISQIIRGNILNENGIIEEKELKDIIFYFENHLNNSQNDELIYWTNNNTGIIDQTIEMTQSLYDCFKVDNAKLDKEIINNTIQSFIFLLNELKYKETISDIALNYTQWKETVVGDGAQKYTQFVLSSDDMIGNPFNFNTWNTQYSVFNIDLETFNHLDSILFYKEGFFVDTEETDYESQWPIGDGGQPDIFVKNLQIYAMNPLDSQFGDYTLNVEPYAGSDIFISSDNPSTHFKATLLRKFYEDLTANGKTSFLWFKEDSSVINSNSRNYHYLGGSGWRKLEHNETNYLFTTSLEENHAYKNNYKCVAIYEPSTNDQTILSFTFSVYNKDMSIDIKLESDLGTHFSFDAGAPIVKVLINEDRENPNSQYQELGYNESIANPNYLYCWTIDDAANGYTLFLDEIFDTVIQESVQEAIILSSKQSLLKRIKTYILEELTDQANRATRIKYPVSIASSGFTITCYVKQYKNGQYYDIGSASLEFENQNDSVAAGYRIHIVNGDQVFQYDEYGNTPCSEKKKNPLTIKPLQAKLFTPSGLEVEGTNYQVEWIFPIESTMIKTAETLQLNPSTNLVQSYTGSEVNFTINDLYDPNAYANQITCHIHFGDVDYYKDTNFYFGKQGNNGTNGTDTVAKIKYNGIDAANILHYQPLTLYVQKKTDGSAQGMLNIGARTLQDNIILAKTNFSTKEDEGILKIAIYQKETLIGSNNYKAGYPKWNIAGNANEINNNTSKFFEIASSMEDTRLVWHYDYNQDKNYRMQNIKVSVQLTDDQMYYAFFSLPIIEYEPSVLEINALLPINRISIDKDFYLNEIVYNQDGRNPVYNHNQGLKLYNIPSNITKVVWMAKGGLANEENKPWISLLEERDSDNGQLTLETIPQDNTSMIYVLPKDIFDGSATNNRVEAKLYEDNKLIATVYAPINMTLNTFGLTSLNAWDGNTVTIDNDGGYIMAPQIGAGEKDNHNRFTGILMGKTETYTGGSDNEEQIGLFGYAHGLQSIFLDSKTGNATFGLPDVDSELDENGNLIYKNYHNTNVQGSDDYNEGRIELRPGEVSKIGGWRLGRRSLYYIEGNHSIGPRYSNDYIPDKTGTIKRGNRYNEHHEKDIQEDYAGVLLHSGQYPYLSIKGKKLDIEKDQLSDSSLSYLLDGDSLEVQIDPYTPTLFTIFRHNGQPRYKDIEKTELLYPEGSRTYLAGINARGQLVANGLQNVTTPTDGSAGDTVTTFGVNALPAFGEVFETATHIGLMMDAADQMISKIFVKNIQQKDSTLYITGSGTQNNEYIRPISLNGKSVGLFASTDASIDTTTDANIQISQNEGQINLGNNTQLFLSRSANQTNIFKTSGQFNWDVGVENNRKNLNINAADLIENYSSVLQNISGQTEINNDGLYNINAKNDIGLFRKTAITDNDTVYSQLTLTNDQATFGFDKNDSNFNNSFIKIDNNNKNTSWNTTNHNVNISVNTQNSIDEPINFSEPKMLTISSQGVGTGVIHVPNSQSQITIYAGNLTDISYNNKTQKATYTRMTLNTSNNNWTISDHSSSSVTGGYWKTDGIPFEVAVNSYSEGNTPHAGSIGIHTNVINAGNNNFTRYYNFYVGMGQRIQGGLVVMSGISATDKNNASKVGIWSVKDIVTENQIWGIKQNMICDGTSSTGSGASISGLGDSGSATFSSVELQSNGRPKLHTHSISVSIPSGSTIYNAIKSSIASQISTALSSYAKKSDLNDYVTKTTYNNHKHTFSYDRDFVTVDDKQSTGAYISSVITGSYTATTSTPKR